MDKTQQQLDDLTEMRKLMERSSRFLSLSGLSGVAAGVSALLGAGVAHMYMMQSGLDYQQAGYYRDINSMPAGRVIFFFGLAGATLLLALIGATYFTRLSAKKKGQPMWDATARRLFTNLAIPLVTGGLFCLVLIYRGAIEWIAPATLIFYGLALIMGSHYTLSDIRSLGIAEIILGLLASVFLLHGLLFWTIGFGILHIIYGIVMFRKYGQ